MKLTKKRALGICRDLWKWLEEDADRNKSDWIEWAEYGKMANYCPCCEYMEQQAGKHGDGIPCCKYCPLIDLFGNMCCNSDNPYDMWVFRHEPQYARIIWKTCEEELKKL